MVIFEKKCGCRVFSFKVGPYLVADFTDFCFVYWDRKLKVSSCRLLLLVIYQSSQSVLHAQWTNERAAVPSIAISLDGWASFSVIERTDYVFLRNGIFFCFSTFFLKNVIFGYALLNIEEALLTYLSNLFHLTQIRYHWKFQFVS